MEVDALCVIVGRHKVFFFHNARVGRQIIHANSLSRVSLEGIMRGMRTLGPALPDESSTTVLPTRCWCFSCSGIDVCFSMGREGQGECGDRGRDLVELDDVHDDAMTRKK